MLGSKAVEAENKEAICAALAALGVAILEVSYWSEDDEGHVDSYTFLAANGEVVLVEKDGGNVQVEYTASVERDGKTMLKKRPKSLEAAIGEFVEDCIENNGFGGYENGSGGGGQLILNVIDREYGHEHFKNVVQREYCERLNGRFFG